MNSETWHLGIPVRDRSRAIGFYSALLGIDLDRETSAPLRFEERADANPALLRLRIASIEEALAVVWSNGGCVLEADPASDGNERFAVVIDTEGNQLTLLAD
jgi:predicted enzyme related to lactoylglutathione lyase